MKDLIKLFLGFFKIGAFTFGGGYAMIPLIEEEVVNKNNWISKEDFIDIVVISQSFPGALAVNISTFVGYKVNGVLGAVIALLGTILPSFSIILIIAAFLMQFKENHYISIIFKGITSAVPVLILIAVINLSKSIKKDFINIGVMLISILAVSYLKLHPIFIIILSGAWGYFYYRKKVS